VAQRLGVGHVTLDEADSYLQYNKMGNLTEATEGDRTIGYTYDPLNRVDTEAVTNSEADYSVDYDYDEVGNLARMIYADGNGAAKYHVYTYGDDNLLTDSLLSQGDPGGQNYTLLSTAHYDYYYPGDAQTPVLEVTLDDYDNDHALTKVYMDEADHTKKIAHYADGALLPFLSLTYSYDSDGLITGCTEARGMAISYTSYEYDTLHRLTGETCTGSPSYDFSYTYDAGGNRLTKTDNTHETTINYLYDVQEHQGPIENKLLSWRIDDDNQAQFYYQGGESNKMCMTGKDETIGGSSASTSYIYRGDNWLTGTLVHIDPDTDIQTNFGYDILGRPAYSYLSGSGVTTYPQHAGSTVLGEVSTGEGAPDPVYYAYGLGRVSRTQSGTTAYYHADAQGSTRVLTGRRRHGAPVVHIRRLGQREGRSAHRGQRLSVLWPVGLLDPRGHSLAA
jgi:YD repeat-containing protein